MRVRILREAHDDIKAGRHFYDSQEQGVGAYFSSTIYADIRSLRNFAGIREGARSYSVYGKQTLDDAAEEWTPVAEGDEGSYRVFKVGVGMPEKK